MEECYSSSQAAVLVQQSTIGAIWWMCSYSRVLKVHSGGCGRTAEYYRNTREALLTLFGTEEYYRSYREAVLVL